MAKEPTQINEPVADSAPVAPVENQDMALDDWASAKSRSLGKRVEALAAFYKLCQQKGVGRATTEQFEADFQVFLKSPA